MDVRLMTVQPEDDEATRNDLTMAAGPLSRTVVWRPGNLDVVHEALAQTQGDVEIVLAHRYSLDELLQLCHLRSSEPRLKVSCVIREAYGPMGDERARKTGYVAGLAKERLYKRLFDMAVSGIVLPISAPFLIMAGLAVKIASPGPAIFTQERKGYHGNIIRVHKLRSMHHTPDRSKEHILRTDNDPRVFWLGDLLRKLKLDEVPQLWNVFKGEMSLVGPRPMVRKLMEEDEESVHGYQVRYCVRPGITGPAQIYLGYHASSEDKLLFDLWYVRNVSFRTDLRMILLTIKKIVGCYYRF
ncbi:MAG: hypothetical protein AMXMBFR81_10610 [Chthonomonas sp.]